MTKEDRMQIAERIDKMVGSREHQRELTANMNLGVQGKESEYMVNKGMVNALYGMMVTNFCRDTFNYIGEWETIPADVQDEIGKYNNKFDRFISYAWGVYVTAHARCNLWTGILACRDGYLYSDTDSIKMIESAAIIDTIK